MMKIPRMSMVTLGVADLAQATAFYRDVLAVAPDTSNEGVTFIQLPGVWLSLFPLEHLIKDIGIQVPTVHNAFSGITLAHNTRQQQDVVAVMQRAGQAGARILKPAQDTFWGGFSGYFADLDGYCWEIAWGPMFDFHADGTLKIK